MIQESRLNELREALKALCSKYGWVWKGGPKVAGALHALSSSICERRVVHLFQHPEETDEQKFDPIFRTKSNYATSRIVDELKRRLAVEGIPAKIAVEGRSEFGVYDIVVSEGSPGISDDVVPLVKVEVKAGLGLPLDQIERYLWDPVPLILVRVLTNQVTLVRPSGLTGFVDFSIENTLAKARRITEGAHITEVPGPECRLCKDFACRYNKYRPYVRALIQLKDEDFGRDLASLLENLPKVAEKASKLVLQELKRGRVGVASGADGS